MKIRFPLSVGIFCFMLSAVFFAQESAVDPGRSEDSDYSDVGDDGWWDSAAAYRLELSPSWRDEVYYLDLSNTRLPAGLERGLSVYSRAGKPLAYHFFRQSNDFFVSAPDSAAGIQLYFGFGDDHQPKFSTWDESVNGSLPEPGRLQLSMVRAWMSNTPEEDVAAKREYFRHLHETMQEYEERPQALQLEFYLGQLEELSGKRQDIERELEDATDETREDMELYLSYLEQQIKKTEDIIEVGRRDVSNQQEEDYRAELKRRKQVQLEIQENRREIETRFFSGNTFRRQRLVGSADVEKVQLTENPFDGHKNIAARFKGKLFAPREGCYTFAVNSRNGCHLVVDDHLVVAWPNGHERTAGWEKSGEILLKAGYHDFAFYYQTNDLPIFAAAAWMPPGENSFMPLLADDFAPASELSISSSVDREGVLQPVVRYNKRGWFLLTEGEKAGWIDYQMLVEGFSEAAEWFVNGELAARGNEVSLAIPLSGDSAEKPELYLESSGGEFSGMNFDPDFDTDDKFRHDPLLNMKLWSPSFIYDDERLQMDIELGSDLAVNSRVLLRSSVSRQNSMFSDADDWLELPGRNEFAPNSHAPSYIWKRRIDLVGAELRSGLELDFSLEIPPLLIKRQGIRFMPLLDCPAELHESPDGLVDTEGVRVVPVLRRLALAEKRTWAFSKSIASEIRRPRKLLIIADDFGSAEKGFSGILEKLLSRRGIELEFISWSDAGNGVAMRASVGKLIRRIRDTDADRVIIIPSARDLREGSTVRLQKRCLASILELCHRKPEIRTLHLATPLPCRRENTLEPGLVRAVHELAEEYGAGTIELNRWFRTRPGWESSYRRELSSSAVYEIHPVQLSEELAQYINGKL